MLKVDDLSLAAGSLHGISLSRINLVAHAGEVVGIAGVAGNGQSELFAALSGERVGETDSVIVMAADLLSRNSDPSEDEIKQAMDPHLCRCATHNAIVRAIKRAARAAV